MLNAAGKSKRSYTSKAASCSYLHDAVPSAGQIQPALWVRPAPG